MSLNLYVYKRVLKFHERIYRIIKSLVKVFAILFGAKRNKFTLPALNIDLHFPKSFNYDF